MRAHSKLNTFDLERLFGPWVRRLSVNVCLNVMKRDRPTIVSLDAARNVSDISPSGGDARLLGGAGESGDPEAAAIRGERSARLRTAIRGLPPHYRAVIELRHFQELSYAEMAEALDWPPTDVKSRLFRARQALARALSKEQTDAASA